MEHFVSASCGGEKCSICGDAATHKVSEDIPHDDPACEDHGIVIRQLRFPFAAYVCCKHFKMIFGSSVPCGKE